jgi:hypothetical protein
MAYFNRVKNVTNDFEWPCEFTPMTIVNSGTDAEGSIVINYNSLTNINTTTLEVFKVTPPLVPDTKYTKTGINLYNGTEVNFDYTSCTKGSKIIYTLNYQADSSLLNFTDGDYLSFEFTINSAINIFFIVKVSDKVV